MTAAEVLNRFSSLGVSIRLADDGTLRLSRLAAERHPGLVEALRSRRDEAAFLLRDRQQVLPFKPDPGRAIPKIASTCPACLGTAFWISLALVRICERCHPPADERIVARRERTEEIPATLTQDARSHPRPDPCAPSTSEASK